MRPNERKNGVYAVVTPEGEVIGRGHDCMATGRIADAKGARLVNLTHPNNAELRERVTAMETYSPERIAQELDQTAQGYAFHGNALRVAKDMPGVTAADRAVLDRYATGDQRGTDHVALADIAIRIRQGADHDE